MKKIINLIIVGIAGVVLIFGIVAACVVGSMLNSKTIARYEKDGTPIVFSEFEDIEYIRQSEQNRRYVKDCKTKLDIAKKAYDTINSDERLLSYNQAKARYQSAKNDISEFNNLLFSYTMMYFSPHLFIAAILSVAIIINVKADRDKAKKDSDKSKTKG